MPVDLTTLMLFAAAGTILVLTPGPDMIYVLTRGIGQGRAAGIVSVLGILAGSFVHASAVALGLASLFAASPLAYDILRYAGAAYLLWLAYKALAAGNDEFVLASRAPAGRRRIFLEALVTNVLNPKVSLFYLTFMPQFVDPARGPVWIQVLFLAAVLNLITLAIKGPLALAAGQVGGWLAARPRVRRIQRWVLGTVFGALALRLAWPERR
jgi:threonine/homoserine/homoserine lactone efflux protein